MFPDIPKLPKSVGRYRTLLCVIRLEERQATIKEPLERAWLHHELGRCYQQLDQCDKSLAHGQQSLDAAVETDDQVWQLNAHILIAESHRKKL
jgi:hypothetical protein